MQVKILPRLGHQVLSWRGPPGVEVVRCLGGTGGVKRTPLPKSDGLRASTSYSGDTAHCPCVCIIRSLCGRERGEITRESRVSGRCGAYGVRTCARRYAPQPMLRGRFSDDGLVGYNYRHYSTLYPHIAISNLRLPSVWPETI